MSIASATRTVAATEKYAAFLSYSHDGDSRIALAVQRALHDLARPWYRLRAVRVFRDEGSLGASSELGGSIESALRESTHLILLASPAAAQSPWVNREVAFWCRYNPIDRLLVVLTDGSIAWDDAAGDFAWRRTTALPRSLAGSFAEEPRYVDLRWVRDDPDRMSLRDAQFQLCIADLAAPLHGRPKDLLIGDDVRAHRRVRRLVRSALLVLIAISAALALLMNIAIAQRASAIDARDRAERAQRVAVSRQLAAESLALSPEDLDTALLLGVQAVRLADNSVARNALTTLVDRARDVAAIVRTIGSVGGVAYHSRMDRLAIVDVDPAAGPNTLSVWDVGGYRRLWTSAQPDVSELVAFDPNGAHLSAVTPQGVRFFDARTGTPAGELKTSLTATSVVISADGSTLAGVGGNGTIDVWNLRTRTRTRSIAPRLGATSLVLSADGRAIAVEMSEDTGARQAVTVWRISDGTRMGSLPGVAAGAVDSSGRHLALLGLGFTIEIWDVRRGVMVARSHAINVGDTFEGLDFSPDGKVVAVSGVTETELWDWQPLPVSALARGGGPRDWVRRRTVKFPTTVHVVGGTTDAHRRPAYTFPGPPPNVRYARTVSVAPAGARRAVATNEGATVLIDTRTRAVVRRLAPMLDVVADATGKTLAYFLPDSEGLAGELVVSSDGGASYTAVPRLPGHAGTVAISADGNVLAIGVEGSVVLRDLRSGRDLAVLENWSFGWRIGGQVDRSITVSADGRVVAYTTRDGVIVWKEGRSRRLPAPRGVISTVELSPDGGLLLANYRLDRVEVVDTVTMTVQGQLDAGFASDFSFAPDGRSFAVGGNDVSIWDADTFGRRELLSSGVSASTVAFGDDGGTLIAGDMQGDVHVWNVDESAIASACAVVGRELNAVETRQYFARTGFEPSDCAGAS